MSEPVSIWRIIWIAIFGTVYGRGYSLTKGDTSYSLKYRGKWYVVDLYEAEKDRRYDR